LNKPCGLPAFFGDKTDKEEAAALQHAQGLEEEEEEEEDTPAGTLNKPCGLPAFRRRKTQDITGESFSTWSWMDRVDMHPLSARGGCT
jgi:hypothetical protein